MLELGDRLLRRVHRDERGHRHLLRVRPVDVGEERVEARAQALAQLGILLRAREQRVRGVEHEVVDPDLLAALGEQRRQRGGRAVAHVDGLGPPPRALRCARAQAVVGRAGPLREPRDRPAREPLLEARRAECLAQMRVRRLEHFEDMAVGVDDRVTDIAADLLTRAHCSPSSDVGNGCHCCLGLDADGVRDHREHRVVPAHERDLEQRAVVVKYSASSLHVASLIV